MSKNCRPEIPVARGGNFSILPAGASPPLDVSPPRMPTMKYMTLLLLFLVPAAPLQAQAVRDDFNRAATTDLAGSEKWRRVLDLTDPGASMQINADSTISPYNPLGPFQRGAVYWDSALSGRFQVGIILRHKSGGNNTPVFHIQLMNDSSWFTGDGYGLRFQENSIALNLMNGSTIG